MAIIFYYIERKDLEETLNKGLKVSESEYKIKVNGDAKPCIIGFLSPKDDILKCASPDYVCLELDANIEKMFVLNGDLDAVDKQAYSGSIIPLKDYKFSTYRRPEIAVIEDVSPEKVAVSSKIIGAPILFESSDKIYRNRVMEELRLKYDDFDETLLSIFFMMMVSKGRIKLLGQKEYGPKTVYVYEDNYSGKMYTLGIQEGNV